MTLVAPWIPRWLKEKDSQVLEFLTEGPSTLYVIYKKTRIRYPTVHAIIKRLQQYGLVQIYKTEKFGRTGQFKKFYGLTLGGLGYLLILKPGVKVEETLNYLLRIGENYLDFPLLGRIFKKLKFFATYKCLDIAKEGILGVWRQLFLDALEKGRRIAAEETPLGQELVWGFSEVVKEYDEGKVMKMFIKFSIEHVLNYRSEEELKKWISILSSDKEFRIHLEDFLNSNIETANKLAELQKRLSNK